MANPILAFATKEDWQANKATKMDVERAVWIAGKGVEKREASAIDEE